MRMLFCVLVVILLTVPSESANCTSLQDESSCSAAQCTYAHEFAPDGTARVTRRIAHVGGHKGTAVPLESVSQRPRMLRLPPAKNSLRKALSHPGLFTARSKRLHGRAGRILCIFKDYNEKCSVSATYG
jgi:hypothetical protein